MFERKAYDAYTKLILRMRGDLAINLFFQPNIGRALAIKTAQRYWNGLDHAVFGQKQTKRWGMRLKRGCFLERSTRNWHYHCIVKLPDGWRNREQFCLGMKWHWQELGKSGDYGRFELVRREEWWTPYIIKGEAWGQDTYCLETSHF